MRLYSQCAHMMLVCCTGHSDNVVSAAISTDSTILATASDDCTARLWNLGTGRCQGVLTHAAPTTRVTLSGDGQLALVACADHTASLWDIATGGRICTLSGHKDAITGAAFNGSGYHVATCSRDSTVRYWSTITGEATPLVPSSLRCGEYQSTAAELIIRDDDLHLLIIMRSCPIERARLCLCCSWQIL